MNKQAAATPMSKPALTTTHCVSDPPGSTRAPAEPSGGFTAAAVVAVASSTEVAAGTAAWDPRHGTPAAAGTTSTASDLATGGRGAAVSGASGGHDDGVVHRASRQSSSPLGSSILPSRDPTVAPAGMDMSTAGASSVYLGAHATSPSLKHSSYDGRRADFEPEVCGQTPSLPLSDHHVRMGVDAANVSYSSFTVANGTDSEADDTEDTDRSRSAGPHESSDKLTDPQGSSSADLQRLSELGLMTSSISSVPTAGSR